MTNCKTCPVSTGTHKPAEALHQHIAEPQTQQPEALRQAEWLRKWFGRDGEMAAALLERQHARIAELEASESRTIAQRDHCEEVIDRMADAVLGKDRHEWTSAYDYMDAAEEVEDRIAELEGQLEAIGAGGVEPLRKPAAQAVHPENIREGAPYDNPEFEQLARDMGVWGTAQSAVCAQFWLAATQPAAQGMESSKLTDKLTAALIAMRDIGALEDGLLGDDPQVVKAQKASRKALDAALAAQAKQGGAANG